MEERFKLIPKLSLCEMALRRAAVNLWYDPDTSAEVLRYGMGYQIDLWSTRDARIHKTVPKLMLPEALKKRMLRVVNPINAEVIKWHWFHKDILKDASCGRFDELIVEPLQWTCTGAVDYRKTAEEILRLELFDVEKRYRLACLHCLEDCIPALWANLPEVYKNRFSSLKSPLPEDAFHLEYYWASVMKGVKINLKDILPAVFVDGSSAYLSFFRYSAHESSRAATEYFFRKLTDGERGSAAFRTLCDVLERDATSYKESKVCRKANPRTFYYMLSIVTREQRTQVFEKYPFCTLKYLLTWPFLDILLEVTDIIWKFLPERLYEGVLEGLFNGLFVGGVCYFPDVFLKIFIRSPSRLKQYFVDSECRRPYLLYSRYLNYAGDTESVKVFWINLSSAHRWSLLCHSGCFLLFSRLLRSGNWQFVEFCFRKLPKAHRRALREHYLSFVRKRLASPFDSLDGCDKDWKLFFESLDETGASSLAIKFSEHVKQRKRKNDSELRFQPQSKIQFVRTSWGWSLGSEWRKWFLPLEKNGTIEYR